MDLIEEPTEAQAIAFKAMLAQVRTTIDGGWKITFDIPHSDSKEILNLAEYRDRLLHVAVILK